MGRFLLLLFSFLGWTMVSGQSVQERYIEKYKDIAIEEMHRTGIPASIKMAQAILESNSGRSHLATEGRNHFGIKCGGSWSGRSVMRKDDDYENGRLVPSCFRAYADAEESFVAHSEFLRDPRKNHRYGFLFRLESTNYKGWAYGLKKAGYATNPKYPKLLIDLIERYNLNQLDAMEEDPALLVQEENYSPTLQRVNDVEFVYARPGERPIEISMDFGVSPEKIAKYNERIVSANQRLEAGERVFLQKKRRSYRGEKKYHYVKAGDDMFSIAQKYGIRLNKLLNKNKMSEGEEPAVGEQIRLRGLSWFESKPVLRSEKESILPEDAEENLPADEEIQALPVAEESEDENAAEIVKQKVDSAEGLGAKQKAEAAIQPKTKDAVKSVEKDSAREEEIATSTDDEVEIPVSETTPTLAKNETDSISSARDTVMMDQYIVQKGDTLYSISRRFGLSVEELKQKNDLPDNGIQIGQALQLR